MTSDTKQIIEVFIMEYEAKQSFYMELLIMNVMKEALDSCNHFYGHTILELWTGTISDNLNQRPSGRATRHPVERVIAIDERSWISIK